LIKDNFRNLIIHEKKILNLFPRIISNKNNFDSKEKIEIKNHDDAYKSITYIANKEGFTVEYYQVTTIDGYVLSLYRIPGMLSHNLNHDSK